MVTEQKVGTEEAEKFCQAFQQIYWKLVYEELSSEVARTCLNSWLILDTEYSVSSFSEVRNSRTVTLRARLSISKKNTCDLIVIDLSYAS